MQELPKRQTRSITYRDKFTFTRLHKCMSVLTCSRAEGSMDTDTRQKRAAFIDRSLLVREQFSFAHPMESLRAVRVYCCDHYGTMLWDLDGMMARQYFNSWSTCIKLAWGVTRATHTYLYI